MKAHGWDFFVMSLAHELRMTRRQLLMSLDSHELAMWSAYFREMSNPSKKQTTNDTEGALKAVLQGNTKRRRHA